MRFRLLLLTALLLVTAHRLPAPIQEVPEASTPAPQQSVKPRLKPSPAAKQTKQTKESNLAPTKQQAGPRRSRFAGSWTGTMPTFPWGSIPQTITIDAAETTMTRLRDWSSTQPGGTSKAEVTGDTLTASFGSGGVLSLTPLADGVSALVRLRAPFNNQTATFHRVAGESTSTKSPR